MNKIQKCLIFIIVFLLILFIKNVSYSYSIGEYLWFSEDDMDARDDLYCVAHDKNFGKFGSDTARKFEVTQIVSITGKESIGANGVKVEHDSNAILASILAGPLEKGYGEYDAYAPAQLALYSYWDEWIINVGLTAYGLGDFYHKAGNSNLGNFSSSAAYYLQQAKNYIQDGTICSVDIYCLRYVGDPSEIGGSFGIGGLQEIILVVPGNTTPPPSVIPQYDGYILISGKVWVDGAAGKSNNINGIYNSADGDTNLGGIKVTLRDKYGNEFAGGSSTRTGASGDYTIVVNYDSSRVVYKLYEDPEIQKQLGKN